MKKTSVKADVPFLSFDLKELFVFRFVFVMLVIRDIKLRYKQTVLGIAWVLIQPLVTACVLMMIFGKILPLPFDNTPYLLFTLCGIVPWMVFSQSFQRGSTCLIDDTKLITKVYFPRVFLPLSATCGVILDFLLTLSLVLILTAIYGIPFSWRLALLPIFSFLIFLFSCGINLLFSSFCVFYRDFKHVLPFLMQLWMYGSPILYSTAMVPSRYHLLYHLNPLSGLIEAFRWAILPTPSFPTASFTSACLLSFSLFLIGLSFFKRVERFFADYI